MVADSFEQARAAAQLLRVDYVKAEGAAFDLAAVKGTGQPKPLFGGPADTARGDFSGAFAAAPVQLDATYTTPDQAHAMMEPHASIAAWDGDRLTLWTSNQMIAWTAGDVAKTLGIPQENVRLLSPFIKPGTVSTVNYNHYSMLRTIEDIFGLSHLGDAAMPQVKPFSSDVFSNS